MALTHLQHPDKKRYYLFACFRRAMRSRGLPESVFIDLYKKKVGKDMCSKCADVLIKQGKLTAADSTVPQNFQLVIDRVTAGTQVLKEEYIIRTIEYAKRMFKGMEERKKWSIIQWYDYAGLKHVDGQLARDEYSKKDLHNMKAQRYGEETIVSKGYEAFEKSEIDRANRHYQNSVWKLSERIMEKSLDINKMQVTTGRVGVNIDTTITDGVSTVNAFTIIAEGPIVRPHYRYLVH